MVFSLHTHWMYLILHPGVTHAINKMQGIKDDEGDHDVWTPDQNAKSGSTKSVLVSAAVDTGHTALLPTLHPMSLRAAHCGIMPAFTDVIMRR